jgi:hypothetical protein
MSTSSAGISTRVTFLLAGGLLSTTSLTLGGLAGYNRGATTLEAIIWCAAGVALSLCSLAGVSATLTVHGFIRKSLAALVYMLGVTFTGISGLGSINCGREVAASTSTAIIQEHERLSAQYHRADMTLSALPSARPVFIVKAEIDTLQRDNRITECSAWVSNVHQRQVCIDKISPLQKELVTAIEKDRLESELSSTSLALKNLSIAKPANLDAASVGRYLDAVGIHISSQRLIDLINFLTVAAIEIAGGATLAIAQSQTVPISTIQGGRGSAEPGNPYSQQCCSHTPNDIPSPELPTESNYVVSRNVSNDVSKPGPRIRSDILAYIEKYKVQNGRLPSGPNIVEAFGVPISTAYLYRSRAADSSNVVHLSRVQR